MKREGAPTKGRGQTERSPKNAVFVPTVSYYSISYSISGRLSFFLSPDFDRLPENEENGRPYTTMLDGQLDVPSAARLPVPAQHCGTL